MVISSKCSLLLSFLRMSLFCKKSGIVVPYPYKNIGPNIDFYTLSSTFLLGCLIDSISIDTQ